MTSAHCLPHKRAEKKWNNDAPPSDCRGSNSRVVEEIYKAHPRNSNAYKNRQEHSKCNVVQALKANDLGDDDPRIPCHRPVEHDSPSSSQICDKSSCAAQTPTFQFQLLSHSNSIRRIPTISPIFPNSNPRILAELFPSPFLPNRKKTEFKI